MAKAIKRIWYHRPVLFGLGDKQSKIKPISKEERGDRFAFDCDRGEVDFWSVARCSLDDNFNDPFPSTKEEDCCKGYYGTDLNGREQLYRTAEDRKAAGEELGLRSSFYRYHFIPFREWWRSIDGTALYLWGNMLGTIPISTILIKYYTDIEPLSWLFGSVIAFFGLGFLGAYILDRIQRRVEYYDDEETV